MHSFQESASPRQCRHSGGLCACVRFLTLTPLRTGTSLKTSIQTCFGITGEYIFPLSASLLKCHYPRNSCWKVLSYLIIVSNIILLLNGLGKEKKWSSSYRVFLFSHLQFFKVRERTVISVSTVRVCCSCMLEPWLGSLALTMESKLVLDYRFFTPLPLATLSWSHCKFMRWCFWDFFFLESGECNDMQNLCFYWEKIARLQHSSL